MDQIIRPAILKSFAAMPPPPDQELREYHRIRYPLAERPTLLLENRSFTVIDVSVRGLFYIAPGGPFPQPRDPIKGILRFRRGAQVVIEGEVVRVHETGIALHLRREIPFSVLLAEQRYLHKRYPMWS